MSGKSLLAYVELTGMIIKKIYKEKFKYVGIRKK